jgi:hypothetical protein
MSPAAGPRYECMGYATFVAAHEDPAFAKWFMRFEGAADLLRETQPERLVWVQHALIDLIDLLDPERDRVDRATCANGAISATSGGSPWYPCRQRVGSVGPYFS